ncbi:hypothetical protein ACLOJK_041373 [Asimina triloba]
MLSAKDRWSMGEREQVTPLSPAAERVMIISRDDRDDEELANKLELRTGARKHRKRGCILLCGCCAATVLILAIVILVLALTVFKVKDPNMKMNSITLDGFSFVSEGEGEGESSSRRLGGGALNMSIIADISIKNPNVASFKFHNSKSIISYRDETIGKAYIPAGMARGKRTLRMNVTIEVQVGQLLEERELYGDLLRGSVEIGSYTKMGGKVNLLNIFKHRAEVTMNCTMTLSVESREIEDQKCKRSIKL